jgi:hypothetical protein
MLDRVHPDCAFANGGSSIDRFEVRDVGINHWLVRQILAFEFDPMIDRRRLQLEGYFFAGMQRRAAESSRFGNGMLELRSHRAPN